MPKGAEGRQGVNHDRIVEAASELVDRQGIGELTLTRVAGALGVTQPALYNHIAGVEDLLHSLALLARQMLVARLRAAAVGRSGDAAVIAVADAWRLFVHQHPGLYAATDRHPLAGYEDLETSVEDIVAVLRQVVATGYGLEEALAEHGAYSLRSAVHGFVVLEAEGGHPSWLDLDKSFELLIRLVCSGLRTMATETE